MTTLRWKCPTEAEKPGVIEKEGIQSSPEVAYFSSLTKLANCLCLCENLLPFASLALYADDTLSSAGSSLTFAPSWSWFEALLVSAARREAMNSFLTRMMSAPAALACKPYNDSQSQFSAAPKLQSA